MKTRQLAQMQSLSNHMDQKIGESMTKIRNSEQNSSRREQQNTSLKHEQNVIVRGINQATQGAEYNQEIQKNTMDRYTKLELELRQLKQHPSACSNAVPKKMHIDPATEELNRKTRVGNKARMIEAIQPQIKDNFRAPKPTKSLSEFSTYNDWRESISRWSLMSGGSHPCQLILEILESFHRKKEDTRARMMLEEIWNEGLETGTSVESITVNRFLNEFGEKMEMSKEQEIDVLETNWFYFEKNINGNKNEWASETVSRLKKLVKDLAAFNRIKNWNEVIKKLNACSTLRTYQEKIGLMMPHVLESESWAVLEKQIDLYEMDKKDIVAKGCLRGKTGKGDKKKVNHTDQSNDWNTDNEWNNDNGWTTDNSWNADNDWNGDWGSGQSSDEKCVESADDQWVNKTTKGEGENSKKVKKEAVKIRVKGNLRVKNKTRHFLDIYVGCAAVKNIGLRNAQKF